MVIMQFSKQKKTGSHHAKSDSKEIEGFPTDAIYSKNLQLRKYKSFPSARQYNIASIATFLTYSYHFFIAYHMVRCVVTHCSIVARVLHNII